VTRERGQLEDWLDQRGFGFIRRPHGAGKLYVHMKSIGKSTDRPKIGDWLEYMVQPGKDGRPVAVDVEFVNAPAPPPPPPLIEKHSNATHTVGGIATRVFGAAVILGLLIANILVHRLPAWVAMLYLIAGVASFILYGRDKEASRQGGWHKPENQLHLMDLTFGIVGGLFAQHVFRHKTRKQDFMTVTALITALHVLLLGLILFGVYAPGSVGEFFRQLIVPG
jgi:uncharacterized membrane protein YsdA (DUF1294 family)/cold shock CspA family protein